MNSFFGKKDINRNWRISTTPNTTFVYPFQTYTVSYYGHSELPRKEKSKFDCVEKSSVYYQKGKFAGVSALKRNFQQ